MVVQFSEKVSERVDSGVSSGRSDGRLTQSNLLSLSLEDRAQKRPGFARQFATGFMEGVTETAENPVGTLYKSGTSLLVGTTVFKSLDMALSRLGPVGKVASVGLAIVPPAVAVVRAAVSEGAESLGRGVFEMSLAWGLGKAGSAVSPFRPELTVLAGTRGLAERFEAMPAAHKTSLAEKFELPETGIVFSKLSRAGVVKRDGKDYFVYGSRDFQSKILLDEKLAGSFERAPYPYRGVEQGTYPLRALREAFYMPNRNAVSEMRFNHAPDGISAAVVPGDSRTIIVNGHKANAGRIFRHEYTHCVSNCHTDLRRSYTIADGMDAAKRITAYAGKNVEESLAETMGLGLLSHSGRQFVDVVHTNPLRSFVANRYLARELNAVSVEAKSIYHDQYLSRSRYIDETAPKLVTPMLEQAASRPGVERHAVRSLLRGLQDTDPVAAKLLTSPSLQSSLNRGGGSAAIFDKLHTHSDLRALSLSSFLLRPGIDSVSKPREK